MKSTSFFRLFSVNLQYPAIFMQRVALSFSIDPIKSHLNRKVKCDPSQADWLHLVFLTQGLQLPLRIKRRLCRESPLTVSLSAVALSCGGTSSARRILSPMASNCAQRGSLSREPWNNALFLLPHHVHVYYPYLCMVAMSQNGGLT